MRMIRTPLHELLVLRQDSVDHLIEHVVGRLAEERRVRMQRLGVFSIEPRDVADDLFSAGPWFDKRHSTLLLTHKRALDVLPKAARLARRSVGWMSGAIHWCKARGDRVPNALTVWTRQPGRERPPEGRWGQERSATGGVAHVPAASRRSIPRAAQIAAPRSRRLPAGAAPTTKHAAGKNPAAPPPVPGPPPPLDRGGCRRVRPQHQATL